MNNSNNKNNNNNTMALRLETFMFDQKRVIFMTHVDADNNIWIRAKDVVMFLGYRDTDQMVRKNVSHFNRKQWSLLKPNTNAADSAQESIKILGWTMFINEPGLYQLLLRSRASVAQKIQDWVCSTVLPSIRQHGAYISENMNNDQMNKLIELIQKKDNLLEKLMKRILELNPRLAIMPESESSQHRLTVLRRDNNLLFCRTQQRQHGQSLKRAAQSGFDDEVVAKKAVPNAINILPRFKEVLRHKNIQFQPKHNMITFANGVSVDNIVLPLLENVLEE